MSRASLLSPQPLLRPSVWVVDDSPSECEAIRQSLSASCRVEAFSDGAEVLEALHRRPPPDVLVLDWHLPGLSGLEVCQHLRGNLATVALPILLLTGRQLTEDLAEGLSAGANDYVFKPFHPTELSARVQALARWDGLRKRALADEQARRRLAEASLVEAQAAEARAWHDAERAFAEERSRLLELTNDAVIIRDLQERIVFWSQGAERLYGWTQAEALGQEAHTLFQTRFPESLEATREALAREGHWEGELLHTTKTGAQVVVASRWAHHRDAAGRLTATLESNMDITRRKQAEERTARLQAATAALSAALTPEDVARRVLAEALEGLGAHAGIVYARQGDGTLRALHDAGYPEEYIRRYRTLSEDVPLPAATAVRTGQPLWLDNHEALRTSAQGIADGGPLRNSQSWAALPLQAQGRVVGSLLISFSRPHGLSPEDRAFLHALSQHCGQALERARLFHEAQAAVRLRDDFLSVASHELKTPLTPLQLRLQILRREAESGTLTPERLRERVVRAAETAEAQVRKLADLVDDLMDVSRISAGRLEVRREAVDLAALVRDVAARFTPQAHKAGCALDVATPDALVGQWDARRLEQVVVNLMTNALKYGAGAPVRLGLAEEAGRARLTVRDQGIGISVADQGRIFERFERAVSDRHFGGLGLGLYICRQILEALGGTISVRSEPGHGATFEVMLPTGAA